MEKTDSTKVKRIKELINNIVDSPYEELVSWNLYDLNGQDIYIEELTQSIG